MGKYITDEGRLKRNRGTGEGADYIPWIKVGDFHNNGTSSIVIDYKTGRQVHLMSRGELYWWHSFRWQNDVAEIREQFPLEVSITEQITDEKGINHPMIDGELKVITTDMLIFHDDGSKEAVSVKSGREAIKSPRAIEKLEIERQYWELHDVPFRIAFREDLNMTYVHNIMDVVAVYDKESIRDVIGLARNLIANKVIETNMYIPLDYQEIISNNGLEELWRTKYSE